MKISKQDYFYISSLFTTQRTKISVLYLDCLIIQRFTSNFKIAKYLVCQLCRVKEPYYENKIYLDPWI